MLLQYALENGFDIYQIYSDEDYSGIDRNRPAFNSMLQAASEHDVDINAIHDHMALIKQQNDHIAKLDAKIAEHEIKNEKFKFARIMLYSGRRPDIKDGIGFQQGGNVKIHTPPKKLSNFVKGKAPMPQDNEGYILYPAGYPESKIRRIHSISYDESSGSSQSNRKLTAWYQYRICEWAIQDIY